MNGPILKPRFIAILSKEIPLARFFSLLNYVMAPMAAGLRTSAMVVVIKIQITNEIKPFIQVRTMKQSPPPNKDINMILNIGYRSTKNPPIIALTNPPNPKLVPAIAAIDKLQSKSFVRYKVRKGSTIIPLLLISCTSAINQTSLDTPL